MRKWQKKLLELYFGENGNKYNFCRTHIQSCDFALGNYAYVEDPDDTDLETFSIARDKEYLLPLIKEAMKKEKELTLLASPWSPPAFMKTNGEMNHVGNYCDAPVMCDTKEDTIDVKLSYYYIGHFSRFIKKGAKRILISRFTDKVEATGFLNPDGSRVVVLLNRTNEEQKFTLCENSEVCEMEMTPHSIMTVCL